MATYTIDPIEVAKVIAAECRDILDVLQDKGYMTGIPKSELNQIVIEHFKIDGSGYGIPMSETISGLLGGDEYVTEDEVNEACRQVLERGEYND